VKVRCGIRDVVIGALYHPPSPIYKVNTLLDYIETSLDDIAVRFAGAIIILAGDLNTLSDQDIVARTSLTPIVNEPTRGPNTLDRIYTSEPCYRSIKVVSSVVKSDHKAVVAYTGEQKAAINKKKETRTYRKRSPAQHSVFLSHLAGLNIELANTDDMQANFDQLYSTLLGLLDRFYPERTITVTSSDPPYVTPSVKALLRRKNQLMRAGRIDEANSLARRIGAVIIRKNTAQLRNVDAVGDSKDMWAKVRELTNPKARLATAPLGFTAQDLNNYYAAISTDSYYQPSKSKLTCHINNHCINEMQVFHILDHLRPTATGLDRLPAWFLRLGAPAFAAPIAQLFNQSFIRSTVPQQWKKAAITPIPKVSHPTIPSQYRPISITPVLSRVMERHIVKTYIYPSLLQPPPELYFHDQFAFRPTGSTTAALIAMLQAISDMLTQYPYVHVFALDFSKAFDTVRHSTLLEKLAKLDLPDEAYNWLKDFFDGHSHCTQFAGSVSSFADILASVIQGSAIGPASYVVIASDLHSVNQVNRLFKFADDTYLLVPSINSQTCEDELVHVSNWARENNLELNQSKSLELLITAPGVRGANARSNPPPPIRGIERVCKIKVLGVVINDRLSADDHVAKTIADCSKSLYAMRVLRTHGMPTIALHNVFRATVLSKLIYCSPAWSGFCSAADRMHIDSFIRRSKRSGYCAEEVAAVAEQFVDADKALLKRVLADPHHTLHHLLPPPTCYNYKLRQRPHNRELPNKKTKLDESNFIVRCLYNNTY